MFFRDLIQTIVHRILRVPYSLYVHEFQSPKKPRATFVFIHGIGASVHAWDEVVATMPKDVRLIGIDLLGFGKSPKPTWAVYNAKNQARSVAVTLLRLRLTQQLILVGHSLGALVSVEVARRYPLAVQELVLCSPPFYAPQRSERKGLPSPDDMLRRLYGFAKRHPDQLLRWSPMAVKLGLANRAFSITEDTVASYVGALEASIINQNSLRTVAQLKRSITIFYGALDPVVVAKNITGLARDCPHITTRRLVAGHEVTGPYAKAVARHLAQIATSSPRR